MMRRILTLLVLVTVTPAAVYAQAGDIRQLLVSRGAPVAFADAVAELVAAAQAEGLPADPIASKALEGWAKRALVTPDRVLAVLREMPARLRAGRDASQQTGIDPAPTALVAAAAEALGRGMTPGQVRAVIESAPTPEAAATGIWVASSLAAQGLETAAAVRAVSDAYRGGRRPDDVLELPSAVAGLFARGAAPGDVARRIFEGGRPLIPVGPGRGPVTDLPGRGRGRGNN